MNITVVGTGYVGLVTGTCFSETGMNVICVDIDSKKIEKLKLGILPIYEPGLDTILIRNIKKERLQFSTNLEQSLVECDVIFIAVGTPPDEDGSADLKHVLNVAREIGKLINKYLVIVTKSTVPVGTSKKIKETVQQELNKRGKRISFDVASNPEFLKEGAALEDFMKPDRIIVGVDSERAEKVIQKLYKPFLLNGHPLIFMDIPSAELTKYAANAMLATKISFINEIANFCEMVGADVNSVRKGIGSDPRIGNKFIYPGIGFGGSCFPKDIKALIKTSDELGYAMEILKAAEKVNNNQKSIIIKKVKQHFKSDLKGKLFALWGLSFKPNTDDMREAPSMVIIEELLKNGAIVKAYDPASMNEAKRIVGNKIEYSQDMYETVIDADALILITEWSEFRSPNYKVLDKLMKQKVIFDGRNIYEPEEMKENGFTYYPIGRNAVIS